jgi:hypothetical protein
MVDRALLTEASRRFTHHGDVRAAAEALVPKLRKELFAEQLAVVDDKAPLKSIRCPRRAGKTSLIPRWLILGSIETGELTQGWGITRPRAKELFWDELGRIKARHNIDAKLNDTELSIRWPWSPLAITRLKGADTAKATERKRGDRLGRAAVDESQLMMAYLKKLVDHVLEPATQDVGGDVGLFGTPGYVLKGFWFEVSRNEKQLIAKGWSPHHWHTRNNAAMPSIWKNFLAMKARKGWADSNPIWVREYLGLWVEDPDALFYAFNEKLNVYSVLPNVGGWSYVLGWDLGSGNDGQEQEGEQHKERQGNDPMALHVWGFSPLHPDLFEVFSWKDPDAGVEKTMSVVERLEKRLGGFISEVADTGGGGKVTVNYVNRRYRRKFKAAEKTGKFDVVRLFNDDLRSGRIKGKRDQLTQELSPWCQEVAALPKDPEDPQLEHPDFDNHNADAGLYSWREARHFWGLAAKPAPPPGSVEAAELEAERIEEEEDESYGRAKARDWWEE